MMLCIICAYMFALLDNELLIAVFNHLQHLLFLKRQFYTDRTVNSFILPSIQIPIHQYLSIQTTLRMIRLLLRMGVKVKGYPHQMNLPLLLLQIQLAIPSLLPTGSSTLEEKMITITAVLFVIMGLNFQNKLLSMVLLA